MSSTLEQFRSMLYGECLPHGGATLAQILMDVEPSEDRAIALAEAFAWFRHRWRSEGAWDAIRYLPPSVRFSRGEGSERDFARVLFPFDPPQRSPRRPPYDEQDFWKWQAAQAQRVNWGLHPERPTAIDKWLTLCEADPQWAQAVHVLAAEYSEVVRLTAQMMPRPGWDVEAHWSRSAAARMGQLECGHAVCVEECTGCGGFDFEAFEAHWGWRQRKQWTQYFRVDADPTRTRSPGPAFPDPARNRLRLTVATNSPTSSRRHGSGSNGGSRRDTGTLSRSLLHPRVLPRLAAA